MLRKRREKCFYIHLWIDSWELQSFFGGRKKRREIKQEKKTTYLIFYFLCDCIMDILIRTLFFASAEIKGDI